MGRQPNVPQVSRDGTYTCWHPDIKKRVNLGTTDYATACSIQAGFYGRTSIQSMAAAPNPPPMGNPTYPYGRSEQGTQMINLDDDKPQDASDILNSWAKASQPANESASTNPAVVTTPANVNTPPAIAWAPTPPVGKGRKAKQTLTPEQSAQLASGLKKIVANLNVIIIGAGVQMFGKVPAPLDDDEVKMLEMGWAMMIDEMFLKSEVKPWHVLLAGNLMIGAAMYVGGTPIPKKSLPPPDPTKAKSGSLTSIDGSKPNG